ncbi:MAG: 5'/3'-nucleotidase SurE [bacterium]|nr:5'/3'-nucleotidase SurE [bacterium]
MKPTILVTNDDGIHSPGLLALTRALRSIGEVYIIAPDREKSAAGHSVTFHHPLRAEKLNKRTIQIDGTPTDCVMYGVLHFLKRKPDLVASGINRGPNLGDDITYSGTVSAAIEGILHGIPSFAISVASFVKPQYAAAARFAKYIATLLLSKELPPDTLLNINVPNLPYTKIKGVEITRQGKRIYRDSIIEKVDPRGRMYYWIGGEEPTYKNEPGTDFYAIAQNKISITPVHLDLTNYAAIAILKQWEIKLK